MTNRDETVDVLVVGGGLAGGLVAEAAARQGKRVVVLERAAEPGGRARSQAQGEHRFNFGPHAIYRGGPMHRALVAAGVPVTGVDPSVGGAQALFADGRLDALPISLGGALRAGWFGTRDAVDFMRAAQAVKTGPRAQAPLHETSAAAWIDSLATRENARTMLAVLVRLATYGGDLHVLSADVAQQQLAAALRSGVIYVHGGWQALVDGLLARVKQAGAQVRHARAASLALGHGDGALQHRVLDAEGRGYRARDVVFACAPHVASSLVGEADAGLAAFARTAQPVTMRCVDLGLRDSRDLRFTLGVDVPFYFSPQRGVRGMAPAGAVSVHAALYLGAEAPGAGVVHQASPGEPAGMDPAALLDQAIDRAVPDLGERLLVRRVLPRAVVHHALPDCTRGGLLGRPACASPVPGVWYAGDWVGPEGHLADAAAASALSVTRGIAAEGEGRLRFAS